MPPKTAQQLIEDEVKEFRRELMRGVTKRGELRAIGYEDYEIDEAIEEEKDEVEREVAEYRDELMAELPEREAELEAERVHIFAVAAYRNIWLPQCLTPVDDGPSTLVTKDVYEHYLAWCKAVGIEDPYSLGTVRNALKEHYGIQDIRRELRAYQLVEVTTRINRNQLISRYESEQRRLEREAAKLRDLTCPYCERRKYDGNRFDRCYWCHRIVKDGFAVALADYMEGSSGRTGDSMRVAYRRMIDAGELDPPPTAPLPPPRPTPPPPVQREARPVAPRNEQTNGGFLAKFRKILGF